jgi:hypothetical protein
VPLPEPSEATLAEEEHILRCLGAALIIAVKLPTELQRELSDNEARMLGEKISVLGLYGLGQQRARALPQDFGELIVKGSWLNQLEHVIVGHGISLLR